MLNTLLIESVFLKYGNKEILKGATIKAEQSKVVGLVGRNGCGKSSLLKVMFGVQQAEDCFIRLNNERIKTPYTHNKLITYLPQHFFLPQSLPIQHALKAFGASATLFYQLFPDFFATKKVGDLSGGQKRILEVYLIIESDSLFSLLDEPFTHIMPLYQQTIMELIVRKKQKKGFIITDHIYKNLLGIADNLYLIKDCHSYIIHGVEDLIFHGYISPSNSQ